ncbi:DUF951 domain-containing protein [Liquorilactobacillus vini]|uniref:DUF951 domain-containing protein n=1 Tax=Liquorilactobacillus vini DSM 20605 TaxID=1133569 RepID=A0A0R2CAD2_9LACO|nr:DUF951 domain-containing protein [Liquorilactobacillus vini]KRM88680.1 hypothetical protein FD21_GL000936 [Liquorilactobacillus vini DSM 20605]
MAVAYNLHDIVEMKKQHPCGVNRWEIIRVGMDIKIKCTGCGHLVMMPRREFDRKVKKVLVAAPKDEE